LIKHPPHVPRNWPALVIGLIMAIYWQRVAFMAARWRKRTGHGANLIPPERIGRITHVIWTPVTVLWIVLPFVLFAIRSEKRYPRWLRPVLRQWPLPMPVKWVAVAVAVVALAATFICWKRMGKSWRMGIDPNDRTQLVCTGPYSYVRHPIYALSTLLMVMTMLIVPCPLMIGIGVAHILLLLWEARREEAYLATVHGEEYRRYVAQTGRIFPRLGRLHGMRGGSR
jgi:protein-S-isoprenylcysteine O-methyltransferase Ste14